MKHLLLALPRTIDAVTVRLGEAVAWLSLLMVLIGAGNAVLRYLGRFVGQNLSSNAFLEAQWYLFSALFLLGAAWTLQQDRHVRVDVLYGRLSPRGQAIIDLAGTVLFLLPFCAFAIWVSFPSVAESWRLREVSPDPGGLPRYPVKALVIVAWWLLIAQGIGQLCKHLSALIWPLRADDNAPEDNAPEDNAPEDNAPEDNAPEDNAPADNESSP